MAKRNYEGKEVGRKPWINERKGPFPAELNRPLLNRLKEKSGLFKIYNPIMHTKVKIIDHSVLLQECERIKKSYESHVKQKNGDTQKAIRELRDNHEVAKTVLNLLHIAKPFEEGSILTTLSYSTKEFKKPVPLKAVTWTGPEFEAYSLDHEEHTPRHELKEHIFAVLDGKIHELIKFEKI